MSRPTHIQLVAEVGARPARATIPLHTLDVRTDGLKTTAHLPDGCVMILHTAATPADALAWHDVLDEAIDDAIHRRLDWCVVRWSDVSRAMLARGVEVDG